jgi:hypothetical protein
MPRKIFFTCLLILLLAACRREPAPEDAPILSETQLFETAVNQVTEDMAETQTRIPTETPTPTHTSTPIPTLDRTRPPIHTPTAELACNQAAAGQPIDVTIPDDTRLAPGTTFSKTWRLVNAGSCTWTRLYAVTFFSGNSLGAQHNHLLQAPVNPGGTIDVTVDMIAPDKVGLYQSNWMLSDPDGTLFGIGPNGDAPFWVRIEVVQLVTDTPHPTATMTPTPVVYITGEADLGDGDQLDLDTAIINPDDVFDADLRYEFGTTPTHLLRPINGMVWAVFGGSEPTHNDCVGLDLAENAVGFDDVPAGTYLCYQTSEPMRGWLLIEGFGAGKLTVSFLTWSAP